MAHRSHVVTRIEMIEGCAIAVVVWLFIWAVIVAVKE